MNRGIVYLVGAGPGDPSLITLRGLQALRDADVVLYDNLCNSLLLREARPDALKIFVGKHVGSRSQTQAGIERLMIRHAKQGKRVARLKGGDPFVFGRGAEEAEALRKQKISFEVIPGITSAIGVPAYAGIPATHRDFASGVAIVTAHEAPGREVRRIDFEALAKFPGTLVFLMGTRHIQNVSRTLIENGLRKSTPAAVIHWGTRGLQKSVAASLAAIPEKVKRQGIRPPSILVVGDVVRCRSKLTWFENKPLLGRRVVVTRSREQASDLLAQLINLGAEALHLPLIEFREIRSAHSDRLIADAGTFDWIFFSSAPAVRFFLERFLDVRGDVRALAGVRIGVVGEATARSLGDFHLEPALVAADFHSKGLIQRLTRESWKGQRVLLPRSAIGRREVEKFLEQNGARVKVLPLYENRLPRLTWELESLEKVGVDDVILASPSAAQRYAMLMKGRGISPELRASLSKGRLISIGPTTSLAIRKSGGKVHREASPHTDAGIIKTLLKDAGRV
jgi:uroporphyrinogen III methyltransferase / synthase